MEARPDPQETLNWDIDIGTNTFSNTGSLTNSTGSGTTTINAVCSTGLAIIISTAKHCWPAQQFSGRQLAQICPGDAPYTAMAISGNLPERTQTAAQFGPFSRNGGLDGETTRLSMGQRASTGSHGDDDLRRVAAGFVN